MPTSDHETETAHATVLGEAATGITAPIIETAAVHEVGAFVVEEILAAESSPSLPSSKLSPEPVAAMEPLNVAEDKVAIHETSTDHSVATGNSNSADAGADVLVLEYDTLTKSDLTLTVKSAFNVDWDKVESDFNSTHNSVLRTPSSSNIDTAVIAEGVCFHLVKFQLD